MDLKRTLFENNIKQQDLADKLGVTKQVVWYWINRHLPKAWEKVLTQYFSVNNIKIYHVK